MIFDLRQMLGDFIGAKKPHNICFTTNDTLALNMIIQGLPVKKENKGYICTYLPKELRDEFVIENIFV